jgi:HK97 family phage prohead protease
LTAQFFCKNFALSNYKRMEPFVLNDETVVNSHGFMLMNAGGRFDRFKSNPVMLNAHKEDVVLGCWDEFNVKGAQILSTPKFDVDDPDALKVKGKVERGFIRGASMGIQIHKAELKQVGNDYVPAVTDWTLLEASIVSVPSNQAAVSLMVYDDKGQRLTSEQVKLSLAALTKQPITKNKQPMESIVLTASAYTALGVQNGADSAAISTAIEALSKAKNEAEAKLKAQAEANARVLLDEAVAAGKVTADKREHFEKLAVADYASVKGMLDAIPGKTTLSTQVKPANSGVATLAGIPAEREKWDYKKWMREDSRGLKKLQAEHPETFVALKAAYGTKEEK